MNEATSRIFILVTINPLVLSLTGFSLPEFHFPARKFFIKSQCVQERVQLDANVPNRLK